MLWKCDRCGCLYSPGAAGCPQCGAAGHTEVDSGGDPITPGVADAAAPEPEAGPVEPARAGRKAAG